MMIPRSLLRDFKKRTGNRLTATGSRDLAYVARASRRSHPNLAAVAILPIIHEVHQYGNKNEAVMAEHMLHGVAMGLGMTKQEASRKVCPHCGRIHDEDGMAPFMQQLIEEISKMAG